LRGIEGGKEDEAEEEWDFLEQQGTSGAESRRFAFRWRRRTDLNLSQIGVALVDRGGREGARSGAVPGRMARVARGTTMRRRQHVAAF
jgi:hypothetical protein